MNSVLSVLKEQALMLSALILSGGFLLTGCSREEDEGIPWYEDVATLKADFAYALSDAQTPLPSEVSTTLMPINENDPDLEWITMDGKKLVLVCTMLPESSLRYWQATDTFRLS